MAIADLLNANTGKEGSYYKSFKEKMAKVHKLNEQSSKNSQPDRSRMHATFDI